MSYPEGWTRKGDGRDVTFSDKNNIVHVVDCQRPDPDREQAFSPSWRRCSGRIPRSNSRPPRAVTLKSGSAIKATYTTESAPNAVTGKRVLLIVDRYELARAGKRATSIWARRRASTTSTHIG